MAQMTTPQRRQEEEDEGSDELLMIRSLLRAESSRDTSQIAEAHEQILRRTREDSEPPRKRKPSATPVSRLLRHSKQRHPVMVEEDCSVREVAARLCAKRQSAALVLRRTPEGRRTLCGICSEVDICRRMVGKGLDPDTPVSQIMTTNPCCVDPTEDMSVVLQIMVKRRFRHLPVVDSDPTGDGGGGSGSAGAGLPPLGPESQTSNPAGVVGLVDITQCLYDAIHKIERLQANQAEFFQAVQRAQAGGGSSSGLDPAESAELAQRALQALMDSISPPVGSIVQAQSRLRLPAHATVKDAALAMQEARMTSVLMEAPLGILTCKDVMARVVAKGLDPAATAVKDVMTPNPDTVRRDSSVLDALHIMQTERYLHLPVVELDGEVCGVLSVLDCAVHTFASSSGKAAQVLGSGPPRPPLYHPTPTHVGSGSAFSSELEGPPLPHQQWRDPDSISAFSEVRSARKGEAPPTPELERSTAASPTPTSTTAAAAAEHDASLVLKVKDLRDGRVYRLSDASVQSLDALVLQLARATGSSADQLRLAYLDEDRDQVQLANELALREARALARQQQWRKLDVCILPTSPSFALAAAGRSTRAAIQDPLVGVAAVVAGLALVSALVLALSPPKGSSRRFR